MEYLFNYLSYKVGFYTIEFQNLCIFQKYIFKNFKIIFTILVAYLKLTILRAQVSPIDFCVLFINSTQLFIVL